MWSGADTLIEVAVRIVNLEETAGGGRDSVGKDDEVHSAGVFGGGVFDPGDAAGIIGHAAEQLSWRVGRDYPGAGHFLGGRAKGG